MSDIKYKHGFSSGILFAIKKWITRIKLLPTIRKKFALSFPIIASTAFPYFVESGMVGNTSFPFQSSSSITSQTSFPFQYSMQVQSNTKFVREILTEIIGSSKFSVLLSYSIISKVLHRLTKEVEIKGKKDFSKIIWELLEEDEE